MNSPISSPPAAPLVSVVVPAYNAENYLAYTVESVIAQTLDSWQCLIVDDGSTDDTAAIARELCARDSRIQLVQQSNAGVSAARNLGLEHSDARAEWVAFLDADDLWEPQALELLVEALRAAPNAVAAHGYAYYIDENGARIWPGVLEQDGRQRYQLKGRRILRRDTDEPTTFAMTTVHHTITTPGCVLIRRDALLRVGGFDPTFQISADWDCWIRLTRLSDLIFVNKALLAYRRHNNNMSSDRRNAIAEVRKLRSRAIDSPDNSPAQHQTARRAYRAFYWYQAQRRYRSALIKAFKPAPKAAAQNLALALANTAMAVKGRP